METRATKALDDILKEIEEDNPPSDDKENK